MTIADLIEKLSQLAPDLVLDSDDEEVADQLMKRLEESSDLHFSRSFMEMYQAFKELPGPSRQNLIDLFHHTYRQHNDH